VRIRIIRSAIILLTLSTTANAHEPVALRLIREYHQQNARIQAEADSQRERFHQWQEDWRRQERARRDALKHDGQR
jgi:hypothetical protein